MGVGKFFFFLNLGVGKLSIIQLINSGLWLNSDSCICSCLDVMNYPV